MYDASFEMQKNVKIAPENQVMYPDVVITLNVHRPVRTKREDGQLQSVDKVCN